MSEAAGREAYGRLAALLRRHENAPPEERPTLAFLALRAALHPALLPWRQDPLRTLDGEFLSLDAQVEALASLLPASGVSPEDRSAAVFWGAAPPEWAPATGAVGAAVWVENSGASAVCVVRAAVLPGEKAGVGPLPVRPISADVAASADAAWAAARRAAGLGADETGNVAVFDVCSPSLSNAALRTLGGGSLGLPLALAFLSALLGRPAPHGVGATGAITTDGRVLPVARTAEKARAFLDMMPGGSGLFLAPEGANGANLLPASTLGDAAAAVGLHRAPAPKIAAPARPAAPPAVALPAPPTPFFGRKGEVALLTATVRTGARRLVTLLGPGGVGKTRLALRVAEEAAPDFPDGTVFVGLEGISPEVADPSAAVTGLVAGALGTALGLATPPTPEVVARAIGERRLLLVLDNFEGALPDGADAVAALLSGAPNLACLITSRAPLLLRAEQRHEVAPLPDAPAAALFRDRARAVRADFAASSEDVAAVCRRLDGIPLALELAAARLDDRDLPELVAGLDDAFAVLASEMRDLPPRQRTLAATLGWSYRLLSEEERRAFRAVSAFAGEFSPEDARALVPDADPDALARQSLLRGSAGPATYRMLPLLREFAAERLGEAGEANAVRDRHSSHLLDCARRHGAAYGTPGEAAAFDALADRWDDLRAAWAFLCERRPADLPTFAAAVCDFLRRRGHAAERREWPRVALEAVEQGRAVASSEVCARLHLAVGLAAKDAGDTEGASREGSAALACAEAACSDLQAAEALSLLGLAASLRGEPDEARRLLLACRERFRIAGSLSGEARALSNLGVVAWNVGDLHTAGRCYGEAADLARGSGDMQRLSYALNGLGNVAMDSGNPEAAVRCFGERLRLARQQGDVPARAVSLLNYAIARLALSAGAADGGTLTTATGALAELLAAEAALLRLGARFAGVVPDELEKHAALCPAATVTRLRAEFASRTLDELLAVGDASMG